jgi:hypothetical protein
MEYNYQDFETEKYNPTEKQVEVSQRVYGRFLDMEQERDKARREFGSRTIKEYVLDGQDAWNGIVSEAVKSSKEDWQSLIFDHKTRGKVKAIISMIVGAKPYISIVGRNGKSQVFAEDMADVYDDAWKQENGSYKLYQQALSACIKGTVIVEEVYEEQKIKVKDIVSVNQDTGEVKYKEATRIKGGMGMVKSRIVPLLDFYPNENSPEIEHDCVVRKQFSIKAFKNKFGKYPHTDSVQKGEYYDHTDNQYKSKSENNDLIDVIFYYNEDWDEYVILANGIWINPQKGDKISPLPFDHKRLPFAKMVFEYADEECFYGKHLPDLMQGEQDTTNALQRLMIDREILSLNRGWILGSGVELSSNELYPGAQLQITGGLPGVPLRDQIMEQSMSGANQSAFQMLSLLKNNTDVNTSVDTIAHGVSSGGRKTARESVILDENSKRSSGQFQLHIYKLLSDRAKLRVEHIKQFYTSPVQHRALRDKEGNEDEETEPVYREITVKKPGREPIWKTIKPEIKGCSFEVWFVEDYEESHSRSARIEKAATMLAESKANPLLSADNVTINWLIANGNDPDKFYLKPTKKALEFQDSQGIPQPNPVAPQQ